MRDPEVVGEWGCWGFENIGTSHICVDQRRGRVRGLGDMWDVRDMRDIRITHMCVCHPKLGVVGDMGYLGDIWVTYMC